MWQRSSELFKFNSDSGWSLESEIRCLMIYKQLESAGFIRGMQNDLCEVLSLSMGIKLASVNAKIGNYKSELGVNEPSNSSEATKYIAKNFGHMSIVELDALLTGLLLGQYQAAT